MIVYLAGVMNRPNAIETIARYTAMRGLKWVVEVRKEYFSLKCDSVVSPTFKIDAIRLERAFPEHLTLMMKGKALLLWRQEERDEFFNMLNRPLPEEKDKRTADAVRILRGRWAGHIGFIESANRYRAMVVVAGTTFEIHRSALRIEL
jgi:hypothetical protein